MYLNYGDDSTQIMIQTPKMRLPYGLGKFEQQDKWPKYSLDMSFGGMEENQKIKDFYETMNAIDEKIINDTVKTYSQKWFRKKTMSEDVARTLFTTSIKRSKDKETGEFTDKYPPTFKAKVPFWEGRITCNVYDHNKAKLGDTNIEQCIAKGQNVVAIIKCAGVWFSGGKYGISWKVDQLKLDKPLGLTGYAFRDDDEDEDTHAADSDDLEGSD